MICARHHAIALTVDDHDWPLCSRCFQEAKEWAEATALEERIMALRTPLDQTSAAWLLTRLGWGE